MDSRCKRLKVMSKLLIDHDAQLLGSGVTATDLLLLSQG
jgi:hypothetical protein